MAGGVAVIAQDVLEIVGQHLKTNGYDGLFSEDGGCACATDDLAPCGQIHGSCAPGYRVEYPDRECPGGECGGGCDWHIGTEKP